MKWKHHEQGYISMEIMEIREGGGVFGLGNPGGRGGHSDPGNPGGRGGSKNLAIHWGGVDFFWNNPMSHTQINKCFVIGVV